MLQIRSRRLAARSLAAACLCIAAGALGQSLPKYDGPDRMDRLAAAAKREGEVTIYTSTPVEDIKVLTDAFERRYGIRTNVWRASSEKVLQRGTTEAKFSVTAVEQRSEFDSVTALADPQKNLVAELGILGVEIDPRMVDASTGLRDPYGIVVAARTAGPLTEVPLLPRDVIRSLNDTNMFTLEQLRSAIRALKPGAAVTLQIQREGRLQYVSFTVD